VKTKSWRALVAAGVLAALATGSLPATAAPAEVTCPDVSAATFTHPTTISNRYLPLPRGTTFRSEGKTKGHSFVDVQVVTNQTRDLDGVRTVVVQDQIFQDGSLTEDTKDFFAQDDIGNVWYFGEESTEYDKKGNTSDGGSWHAGIDGEPGFIMEADPQVGDTYCQENAPSVAEDRAQVVAVGQSLVVPYGTFNRNVVVTKEFTPLEPGKTENKFYGPCVGEIKSEAITGGTEVLELTSVRPRLRAC
jgi:hypothetical protein